MLHLIRRLAGGTTTRIALVALLAVGAFPAASAEFTPAASAAVAPGKDIRPLAANHSGEVRRLYLAYFRREPDRGGITYWAQRRVAGVPLQQVSSHFAASSEFRNTYGSLDNARFLALIYENVLGREQDPVGRRYWIDRLNRGTSRGEVMVHFSESNEFRRKTGDAPAPSGGGGGGGNGGGNGGGPVGAGAPDIASNFDVNQHLMTAWGPPDDGYPAFRLFCQFSHLAFADPILAPGNDRFMHLHMFFGNRGADHRSTYESLRTSGGGTCDGGPINRTAYWMPAVFDDQGQVVVPDAFELYYKGEIAAEWAEGGLSGLQPYPNGLRLVAGATIQGDADWGWRCEGGPESHRGSIPDCPDGQRLSAWVRFPYCWDGQRLWAPNNEHVVFGEHLWRKCPSSHPVHLPELTQFAHFDNTRGDTSRWYVSSDRMHPGRPAPNGSTLHADWFNAWDRSIQERWVNSCLRANKTTSNGNLCDGQQLRQATPYQGSKRIGGWGPTPTDEGTWSGALSGE